MKLEKIEQINRSTRGGDIVSAARKFLGLAPNAAEGNEAAVNGIVDEVIQWNKVDKETRSGIEAYKAAKVSDEASLSGKSKSTGKTPAKSKK